MLGKLRTQLEGFRHQVTFYLVEQPRSRMKKWHVRHHHHHHQLNLNEVFRCLVFAHLNQRETVSFELSVPSSVELVGYQSDLVRLVNSYVVG